MWKLEHFTKRYFVIFNLPFREKKTPACAIVDVVMPCCMPSKYTNNIPQPCIATLEAEFGPSCQINFLQGVPKFLPQLSQGIALSHVASRTYAFNHVIYTSREFFWHMKHHGTFIGSWVMSGNSFQQDFCKIEMFNFMKSSASKHTCIFDTNGMWKTQRNHHFFFLGILVHFAVWLDRK